MNNLFVPAGSVWPVPPLKWHVIVAEGQLLCSQSGFLHQAMPDQLSSIVSSHYLGTVSGVPCGVHLLAKLAEIPGFQWESLRGLLSVVDEVHFALAGRALQVVNWDQDHQYCGRCGKPTHYHAQDRARVCASCELAVYPRISPCVIMLVTRGDECLLARHQHQRHAMFTALAGFIEPGESAEQALEREVREEVGLEVGRLRYIGSQTWPFPGQLMLGYLAEWSAGTISLDDDEIAEAAWFHRNCLPETIPPAQTLSGQLIRHFLENR